MVFLNLRFFCQEILAVCLLAASRVSTGRDLSNLPGPYR